MPFIGTQPEVGGYSVLDALTASATASYTLQKDSANFVPNTANQLLVSLNGVIQKPGSSFTVSGSTLTFSSALTSSDSIDFIIAMGEPLLIGTPSDGTVTTAKIATDAVTSAKIDSTSTGMTLADLTVNSNIVLDNEDTTLSGGEVLGKIEFKDNDGGSASAGITSKMESLAVGDFGASALTFHTSTSGGGARSALTERFRIQHNGGVTFNGDTSDANALDDYEEGSFTPSVTFGGASSGVTYSSSRRIGKYTKIGNVVEYFIHVELTSKGSSTGAVQITGLPFTVVGDQHYIPGAVFIASMASLASGAPIYRAMTGSTVLDCYEITNSSYGGITNSNYTNSTGVQVSGKYYTS